MTLIGAAATAEDVVRYATGHIAHLLSEVHRITIHQVAELAQSDQSHLGGFGSDVSKALHP